jgi:adenylate kinase
MSLGLVVIKAGYLIELPRNVLNVLRKVLVLLVATVSRIAHVILAMKAQMADLVRRHRR